MSSRFSKHICGFMLTGILSITTVAQIAPLQLPKSETPKVEKKQAACSLTQATLPLIAGVRMGATYDDVLSLYPEITDDKFFQGKLETENGGLTNVRAANLFEGLDDGKPVKVGLFFKDRILVVISNGSGPKKYKPIVEAVAEYSKQLGISEDQWTIHYGTAAELRCVDFAFYVNADESSKGNSMSVHSIPKERK